MMSTETFELHGKENIPEKGALVIPSRLAFDDLSHLEKLFEGRRLIFLFEANMTHDTLIRAHLEKEGVEAWEMAVEEPASEALREKLRSCLSAEPALIVYVPGITKTRNGQIITIPRNHLARLVDLGLPVLPLFVDHPAESCLTTENRLDVDRIVFSFGSLLEGTAATLSGYRESMLAASETAYSRRPVFESHLGYEILKGLKIHGKEGSIIDGTDESELPYDKLLGASLALARKLKKLTDKKRIGIILPPGKAGLLANVAAIFAGKIPVNLNFTAGKQAIDSCIAQAELDRFITAQRFIDKMDQFSWPEREQLILLDEILPPMKPAIAFWLVISKLASADLLAQIIGLPRQGGDDEAVLLFTSGSSGNPKGVVLSHRNLLSNVNQFGRRIDLKTRESVLGSLPLFHSFGCTVTMWYPLIEGISLVTYPSPLEPARHAELIEKHSVSLLIATPTFLRGYIRRASREQFGSLKMVITGAEKLPGKVAEVFERRFGIPVLEGYGLTETSPVASVNLPDLIDQEPTGVPIIPNARSGSVGLPIPGVAVRITDPESHAPLPLNTTGMIWLKGSNIFREYLDLPDKTAEVKIDDWFMTGDIGRVDEDGFLYIEGRLSRFSKIGGEMVPHETIENAITQSLQLKDDVRHIAVIGVPDEAKGESLVLLSIEAIDQATLRQNLIREGLPALWVPRTIVPVEEIPILASGKLDIKTCEQIARGQA